MTVGILAETYPLVRLVETALVSRVAEGTPEVCGPDAARRELGRFLRERDREYFAVMHLNARHQAVSLEVVAIGSLTGALVHPREVFKAAVLANAAALICAHNHPSGDVTASAEDMALLRRLSEVGELLGIPVLDFLVVSGEKLWSAHDSGAYRPKVSS